MHEAGTGREVRKQAGKPAGRVTLQARALTVNNRRGRHPVRSHRLVRARGVSEILEDNMRASLPYTMRRSVSAALFGASLAIGAPVPACANVITDWDDKALVLVT